MSEPVMCLIGEEHLREAYRLLEKMQNPLAPYSWKELTVERQLEQAHYVIEHLLLMAKFVAVELEHPMQGELD